MTRSKTIAGLLGPTLLAIAAALLLNLDALPSFLEQASREPLLIFLTGIPLLVAGLAIVRNHNVWRGGWPVLVTLLGWILVAGGVARILFPTQVAEFLGRAAVSAPIAVVSAVVLAVVGGSLTFKSR